MVPLLSVQGHAYGLADDTEKQVAEKMMKAAAAAAAAAHALTRADVDIVNL